MIEDSKWVKGVASNAPKKGWKIQWHDDKYDNIFDESWLKLLSEAQKDNHLVHFTKEQNEKGYWNIKSLNLVDGSELPPAEKPPIIPEGAAPEIKPKISGQEVGLWWKEMGECLRSGEIDKTTSTGKALRLAYYAQMFSVLGIDIDKGNPE